MLPKNMPVSSLVLCPALKHRAMIDSPFGTLVPGHLAPEGRPEIAHCFNGGRKG
ncbi:MAG: hypothetical protein Q3M24_16865 [Candidatus Electrothrix aestuarii]|uniref:Uncharacterized protein n=1 Tax=Candidatus Electrothrix aestuarii TaxID=3062594 RepID=A0AAU8LS38_9BACT